MVDFHGVPLTCINTAAQTYKVPADLIMAIITVEGGKNGLAMRNHNGTKDYGVMQINSCWLPSMHQKGYTLDQIRNDPCINVDMGASILSQNLIDDKDLGKAIGNYHSHTPLLNAEYALEVVTAYGIIHKTLAPKLSPSCLENGLIC